MAATDPRTFVALCTPDKVASAESFVKVAPRLVGAAALALIVLWLVGAAALALGIALAIAQAPRASARRPRACTQPQKRPARVRRAPQVVERFLQLRAALPPDAIVTYAWGEHLQEADSQLLARSMAEMVCARVPLKRVQCLGRSSAACAVRAWRMRAHTAGRCVGQWMHVLHACAHTRPRPRARATRRPQEHLHGAVLAHAQLHRPKLLKLSRVLIRRHFHELQRRAAGDAFLGERCVRGKGSGWATARPSSWPVCGQA